MSLTYFIATLPRVSPEGDPPMTEERFLELARRYLAPAEMRALEDLALGRPTAKTFILEWRRHETQLRNAMARLRAARLGADASPWLRSHEGYDVTLEREVAAAFQEPDPLRREKALDASRLRRIGELGGFDPMSIDALLAYFLRLRMANAAKARDEKRGMRRLDEATMPPEILLEDEE